MWLNIGLILLVLAGFIGMLLLYMQRQSKKTGKGSVQAKESAAYQIDDLIGVVKEGIDEMTRTNLYEMGLSEESFRRQRNQRNELKKALKSCTHGSIQDKMYVKDYIKDLLREKHVTPKSVDRIMAFDNPQFLGFDEMFEILLHVYKKSYGYDGLGYLIEKYSLDELKYLIEDGQVGSYVITGDEIRRIYNDTLVRLSYEDKLEIITQRVYQSYKGFGVVDELRDMNIDGISGGVSGLTDFDNFQQSDIGRGVNGLESVWIFYKGKSIHLSFLSFGSEKELRRICQNIYRYNKAGQLSERDGYRVNEMKDGSRVVVVRPSFSESWAFFVRKFHIKNVCLEELIQDTGGELPTAMLKYLVKGARITSITGAQGCGKTTMLMAMVKHIYGTLTLRVQEMAFELHLRKVYPMRNILTFKETSSISGQAGLDLQKKTDGSVSILGEVATDEVAAWMLQMAQVASLFTLFTHHGKTVNDLVLSLRNALLKCDIFRDEKIAEEQVVSVLDFDVHLERDVKGHRYISRITEIVQVPRDQPYPMAYKEAEESSMTEFMDTMTEYFRRCTDRTTYETRDIIVYENGVYRVNEMIQLSTIKAMKLHMTQEDGQAFDGFIRQHWRQAV